jgi:hypothetical protein
MRPKGKARSDPGDSAPWLELTGGAGVLSARRTGGAADLSKRFELTPGVVEPERFHEEIKGAARNRGCAAYHGESAWDW